MLNLWQVFCQDSQNEKWIQMQRILYFRVTREEIQPAKHKTVGSIKFILCILCSGYCSTFRGWALNKINSSCPYGAYSLVGKTECLNIHFTKNRHLGILNFKAFLVAQSVKNLTAVWETQFRFLGWKDPLEKGMATHSSVLTWRIPWIEEPGRLQTMG